MSSRLNSNLSIFSLRLTEFSAETRAPKFSPFTMSTTNIDPVSTTTTTPLLGSPAPSRRFPSGVSVHSAAVFLGQTNSRRMMSQESLLVRQSAAQQIQERRTEWAYSKPIVILDLIWNMSIVLSSIIVISLSKYEVPKVPLRSWIVGYCVLCIVHMVCVCVEFRRRRREARLQSSDSNLDVNDGGNAVTDLNPRSNSSSSVSSDDGFVEIGGEPRQNEDNTSVARHLESASTMLSFIWWIMGFYWIQAGGQMVSDDAPKLYWLTTVFLALDVFFVMICVIVACIIGIAVCCCLPCIIAILYTMPNEEGASREDVAKLTKYKFRRVSEAEKSSGEIQELSGGFLIECDTDTSTTLEISADDVVCVVCLSDYENGDEIHELPCSHRFHCECIDKWLYMKPTCPLCKYNILKNGNHSTDQV